jgi:PQQ-dependent dehydrogenase (methanol/ethanol family)
MISGCGPEEPRGVDDESLATADADSANWLTYGRTYSEQRFSPLSEINDGNVDQLGLLWSVELPTTRGLEATPLVYDGVMYTTGSWSIAYAFDAVTGQELWRYDPQVDRSRTRTICCDVVNRGLAMYEGHVYLGTLDGRLVAIDMATGRPSWDVMTIDQSKPYAITGAPIIADGRVLIGNAGGEYGIRGYVSAYDAVTGEMVWRTHTVPGNPADGFESEAMEVAAATWSGEWWEFGGGAPVWGPIVYDPELDLVYFGTGNGVAWYRDLRSPEGGDNLYVASILAVRAGTGEQVWYFQQTPGDNWDYDATQPILLADLTIDGADRKVLMQASKNGFFYVLDRETGAFISGTPFVDGIDWATGLDPETGRPIESPTAYTGTEGFLVSPDPEGAHNWQPIAFDPGRGLVYMAARANTAAWHAPDANWESDPSVFNAGFDPEPDPALIARAAAATPRGELVAWSPAQRRAAWRVVLPASQSGGVLATAGNLVFQGRGDGMLAAYRSDDGTKLWEFDAGTGIMAPPVTYAVDGRQYVTVMVGFGGTQGLINPANAHPMKFGWGRVVTFALGGGATLTPRAYGHTEPPTPAIEMNASPETIVQGAILYGQYCIGCHGADAVAGIVPDLRYATAEVHGQIEDIVLGGARAALGMPSFGDKLDAEQLRAIQAYVLAQAAEAVDR